MRPVVFGLYYPVNETFDEAAVPPAPPGHTAVSQLPTGQAVSPQQAFAAGIGGPQGVTPPKRITARLYTAITAAARLAPSGVRPPVVPAAPAPVAPIPVAPLPVAPIPVASGGPAQWIARPGSPRQPKRRRLGKRQDGLPHDVLGLFSPKVIQLRARLGGQAWTPLDLPHAGLYRPAAVRLARWTGLAYEPAPVDGVGLSAGAHVLTMRGEVAVEHLRPSDRLVGLRGPRVARIAWIGQVPGWSATGDAALVRIPAHGLGRDEPTQDIVVGPNQVLFPDGTDPILARDLVRDGRAHRSAASTELFQIVLAPYPGAEDGDVLLVDGIFAASSIPPAPQGLSQPGVENAVVGAWPILRG